MIQYVVDGLVNGSIIALGAVGLSITYNVLRFANFAQGEILAIGAYMSMALIVLMGVGIGSIGPVSFGWPLLVSIAFSIVLTSVTVLAVDWMLFRVLRRRSASRITFIIAAFGLSLIIRNVITLVAGADQMFLSFYIPKAIPVFGDFKVVPDDVVVLIITAICVVALHSFLTSTTVAENPVLAMVNGINVKSVIRWSWVIGASLSAIAGTLHAHVTQLDPEMGFELILPMFAALIVGGVTNVYGAVLGGFLIGLTEAFAVSMDLSAYRGAIAFSIMIVVLILRPQGIMGEKERDD